MSDIALRAAEKEYLRDPNVHNAELLTKQILRNRSFKICRNTQIIRISRAAVEISFSDKTVLFSGNEPVAYKRPIDIAYMIAVPPDEQDRISRRNINTFVGSFEREYVNEIQLNWDIAETYTCRLAKLINCYKESEADIAGLIADTYIQHLEPAHGTPLRVYYGIDGRFMTNVIIVDLGKTFKVLLSYETPVAAINKITGQCFYTRSRTMTTASHIGVWFRSENKEQTKWQKDCIEYPQCVFDAIFSQ